MSIKDIIEKIKSIFPSKLKRLEANKDKQYRIKCEREGRLKDFEEYLSHKKRALDDIARFQKYIQEGRDVKRWSYELKSKQRELEFIRPNNPSDIKEREYWGLNFFTEFSKVIPENLDLRFHGTSIYNTKAIIESGGIFSSVDINDGYRTSTDLSGEISASTTKTLDRTIQGWFADFVAYIRGLPCGCIFALNPRTDKDIELKKYDAMQSVNFKEHPEQLYGIFTSTENISNVRNWMQQNGFNPDLVYTFEEFLRKIESEKRSGYDFKSSISSPFFKPDLGKQETSDLIVPETKEFEER